MKKIIIAILLILTVAVSFTFCLRKQPLISLPDTLLQSNDAANVNKLVATAPDESTFLLVRSTVDNRPYLYIKEAEKNTVLYSVDSGETVAIDDFNYDIVVMNGEDPRLVSDEDVSDYLIGSYNGYIIGKKFAERELGTPLASIYYKKIDYTYYIICQELYGGQGWYIVRDDIIEPFVSEEEVSRW